jgi:hypothetical protein
MNIARASIIVVACAILVGLWVYPPWLKVQSFVVNLPRLNQDGSHFSAGAIAQWSVGHDFQPGTTSEMNGVTTTYQKDEPRLMAECALVVSIAAIAVALADSRRPNAILEKPMVDNQDRAQSEPRS